ncbi:hypothetical protein [Nostoc sp. NZL]|uniref:hypothetical protein n=1 Tax=Nostoc sp. NZL TaxID=2650612 RepID=UPI0018C5F13E|nr:hypothetical protein [Nostoc sp. NZL]MBG1243970.1 hypothetical protein [Nostoc sp. NZL]
MLFILVGPKGAGKTHIGTLVNAQMAIKFFPVEPIWIDYLNNGAKDRDGWDIVEEEINRVFESNDRVMIESLGAGEGFTLTFHGMWKVRRALCCKVNQSIHH